MTWIDILILAVLAFFLLKGIFRGLLKEVCSLLGLVLGGVLAFVFHLPVAQVFQDRLGLPAQLSIWGAYLGIFLLTILCFGVLGFVLHRFVKLIFLGGFNRLAGAVFGLAQGVVLLAMVMLALNSTMVPDAVRKNARRSQLAPPFEELGRAILTGSRELIGQAAKP